MELFILDASFRKTTLIDQFESFIWTERYSEIGEFVVKTAATKELRLAFRIGTYVAIADSDRVMTIDTVKITTNSDGSSVLTAEGQSLESLFKNRAIASHSYEGGMVWKGTGTIGEIVTLIVSKTCVTGTGLTTADVYPNMYVNDESGTTEDIAISIRPQSLFSAIKEICDSWELGFRLRLHQPTRELGFTVYKGHYRPQVIFSSMLDNLSDESYAKSNRDYRNIAYVWAKDGARMVQVPRPGLSVYTSGFNRRVMHVDAEDIDFSDKKSTDSIRIKEMQQRGLEELAKNRRTYLMDGVVSPNINYTYGTDYKLGDIVRIIDEVENTKRARIVEQIWVHDREGFRTYPTFEYEE